MGLIVSAGSESNFIPVPAGMHLARCYRIIDLGTQKSEYMGNIKHLKKLMIQFEVHSEDDQGNPTVTSKGDPMTVSKNYTAILAKQASLRIDLESWRGRPFTEDEKNRFDLHNILGQWAMITVGQTENNGRTYTNILNINPVPANIKKAGLPEGVNELKTFSIDDPDMALFETFSEGLRDKIKKSPEWEAKFGSVNKEAVNVNSASPANFDDMADDVPF